MANVSRKNLFGYWLGLTRATTAQTGQRLFSKNGFVGSALFLSTTEGSETEVKLQGWTDIEPSSTGTAALATLGLPVVDAAASSLYTMAAPPASGIRRTLYTTSTSTLVRQITSASNIVVGASVGGDSGTLTASTAMTVMTFNGLGQAIELLAVSTGAWLNVSLRGFSTGATPLSS